MLHTSAVSFTDFLYRHCNLPIGRKSVYVYGAELFFSTSFGTISILLIAVLAGQFISGILFLLVFISLRIFVGGFHASTYGQCFLLSNTIFLISLATSWTLRERPPLVAIGIMIPAIITIWILAPISNPHHPLSKKAYTRNRKLGRVASLFEGIISALTSLTGICPSALSITSASCFTSFFDSTLGTIISPVSCSSSVLSSVAVPVKVCSRFRNSERKISSGL